MDKPELEISAHCQLNAMTLRACGDVIGVDGFQYALAFFDVARADGLTVEQMCNLLRAVDKSPRQQVANAPESACAPQAPGHYRH